MADISVNFNSAADIAVSLDETSDISVNFPFEGQIFSTEYALVYNAFPTKPNAADTANQEAFMQTLVDNGLYAKAEFIDWFSTPINTGGEAEINWRNPGTFDPAGVNTPVHTAYAGFTGNNAATRYVRLNFNPTTDGSIIGQNNICLIWGIGNNVSEVRYDIGGFDGALFLQARSNSAGFTRTYCNDATIQTRANANTIKHYAMSRSLGASYESYINLARVIEPSVSTGLLNIEMYACATNSNGAPFACNRQLRYAALFSYLTEAEITIFINAAETLLDTTGTGLIP